MNQPLLGAAAVAFWVFLAVTVVGGMMYDYYKRRLEIEALRMALERGQALDPDLVKRLLVDSGPLNRLFAPRPPTEGLAPEELRLNLRIGGVITVAAGIGVAVFAPFAGQLWPLARAPLVGLGLLTVCVGIGLSVAARLLRPNPAVLAQRDPPA